MSSIDSYKAYLFLFLLLPVFYPYFYFATTQLFCLDKMLNLQIKISLFAVLTFYFYLSFGRSKRTKRASKISLPVWAHFQIFILYMSILLKQKGQDDPAGRMKI